MMLQQQCLQDHEESQFSHPIAVFFDWRLTTNLFLSSTRTHSTSAASSKGPKSATKNKKRH